MEAAELDVALEELETRLERLRALYEQYFMGLEKIEPSIARKDVDRRIYVLRREKIRNTAKRFKLQTIIQRYNTFQQYWQRICREIENGTYKRHLLRAQKNGELLTIAARKRLGKQALKSDPAPAESQPPAAESRPPSAPAPAPAAPAPALPEGAAAPARLVGAPPIPRRPPLPSRPEAAPMAAAPLGAAPPDPAAAASSSPGAPPKPVRPPAPPPKSAPSAATAKFESLNLDMDFMGDWDPGSRAPQPTPAKAPPPKPASPAAASPPKPAAPPARPPAPLGAAPPRIEPLPKPAGLRPASIPPAPVAAPPRPASSRPPTAPLVPRVAPSPRIPASPRIPPPPVTGTRVPPTQAVPANLHEKKSGENTQLGVAPPANPPPTPAELGIKPPAPTPAAAAPSAAAVAARAAAARATATAERPPAEPPKPAAATSSGVDDARMRDLHSRLQQAKQQTKEANVSYEGLAKSIRATEAKLREQHKNRKIDFDVVIKDGKAVVKPIVR